MPSSELAVRGALSKPKSTEGGLDKSAGVAWVQTLPSSRLQMCRVLSKPKSAGGGLGNPLSLACKICQATERWRGVVQSPNLIGKGVGNDTGVACARGPPKLWRGAKEAELKMDRTDDLSVVPKKRSHCANTRRTDGLFMVPTRPDRGQAQGPMQHHNGQSTRVQTTTWHGANAAKTCGQNGFAQIELRKQNMWDFPSAIVAAYALANFHSNKESLEASSPPTFMKNRKEKEVEWKKDSASIRQNGRKNHSAAQGNNNLKNQGCSYAMGLTYMDANENEGNVEVYAENTIKVMGTVLEREANQRSVRRGRQIHLVWVRSHGAKHKRCMLTLGMGPMQHHDGQSTRVQAFT
ncbi:hypothetical protein ZIOFF_019584 [Zingiber officinale]|uniref:Uncharacterized protein n=1 Tax=Zingiber officinale TaxID=94328 RepID=A0A8J5H7L4_ZINOF|nr:hypothetical protein ZIOFF_019584 [Zingiber officinale]